MAIEYYKCGITDILALTCIGPFATEEEAAKNNTIWWAKNTATLSVFKYQPAITKKLVLQFKHAYASVGTVIHHP